MSFACATGPEMSKTAKAVYLVLDLKQQVEESTALPPADQDLPAAAADLPTIATKTFTVPTQLLQPILLRTPVLAADTHPLFL